MMLNFQSSRYLHMVYKVIGSGASVLVFRSLHLKKIFFISNFYFPLPMMVEYGATMKF